MAKTPATVDELKKQLRLLWGCLVSVVPLYGLATFLKLAEVKNPGDEGTAVRDVFTVIGIILGGTSVWWRRHFLSSEPSTTAATPLTFRQLQTHSVVVWLCCDAVALTGLVAAFFLRNPAEFIPFGVAATALLVMHHPFRLPYDRLRVTAE